MRRKKNAHKRPLHSGEEDLPTTSANSSPTLPPSKKSAPELIPEPTKSPSPPPSPMVSTNNEDGVIPDQCKGKRKRFRPRPHPAKTVLERRDLFRDPTAFTVLFRPSAGNNSLHTVGLRALSQAFSSLPFKPIGYRKIRDGGLALDFASSSDTAALLAVKSLASIAVRASLPLARKQAVGTIRGEYSCAEEVHELYLAREENPRVESIVQLGSSNVFKLTFVSSDLPSKVRVFYNLHRVQAFFDHPTRCYKCHRFNHISKMCRSVVTCRNCGAKGEEHETCNNPPRCANCGGPHPVSDRLCPHRLFELQVQKFKSRNNSSLTEAKLSVAASYADVLKGASSSNFGPRSSRAPTLDSSTRPSAGPNVSSPFGIISPTELITAIQQKMHDVFSSIPNRKKAATALLSAFDSLQIPISIPTDNNRDAEGPRP